MEIGKRPSTVQPFRCAETFRMVPDRLWLDPRVKPFDIRLWCALAFFARDRGLCMPTDATLAEKLGVSDRTIRRGLRGLEDAGFVRAGMEGRERVIRLTPDGDGQPIEEYQLRVMAG